MRKKENEIKITHNNRQTGTLIFEIYIKEPLTCSLLDPVFGGTSPSHNTEGCHREHRLASLSQAVMITSNQLN